MLVKLTKKNQRRGAVLIIIAISLIVLIGSIGFATDMYVMTATRTQYQGIADRLSLAVLEAYLYEDAAAGTTNEALEAATAKAQALLGKNVNVLLARGSFSGDGSQEDIQMISDGSGSGGLSGYIQPGRWFTSEPTCSASAPIFCPLTAGEIDGGVSPNAFRVHVKVNSNSPIKTTFLKLLGLKSFKTGAKATAALTPRRAVFLLDLSGSIHETTHRTVHNSSLLPGQQSYYAYPLRTGVASCADTTYPVPVTDILSLSEDYPADFGGIAPTANPRDIFTALGDIGPPFGLRPDVSFHYKDDFVCFDIDTDDDGSADTPYAIDTVTLPQPLTDILQGINVALTQFQSRAVAGDRIMIAGFDDEIISIRATQDGSSNTILVPPSIGGATHPEFQRFLDATSDIPANSHLSAFLFPRQWGRYGPGSPWLTSVDPQISNPANPMTAQLTAQWGLPDTPLPPLPAQTNLYDALYKARVAIKAETNWETSDNFVVIFSDGLSNCPTNGYLRAWGLNHYCASNQENFYYTGIASVTDLMSYFSDPDRYPQFSGDNIPIHFVLTGKTPIPHTLMRPGLDSNNGRSGNAVGCLTDAQSRNLQFPHYTPIGKMVDRVYGKNFPEVYPEPSRMHGSVARTSGLWLPLRSPCSSANASINNGWGSFNSLEEMIENRCQATAALDDYVDFSPNLYLQSDEYQTFASDTNGDGTTKFATRIFCDIKGRTTAQQITEMFEKIMNTNPYILVE